MNIKVIIVLAVAVGIMLVLWEYAAVLGSDLPAWVKWMILQ